MPYNPFTGEQDESVMSRGAMRTVGMIEDAATRDPLLDEAKALSQQRTQLGQAKSAAEQIRDKFLDTEGSDLFERDPATNKPLKNPDGTYVPKLESEIEGLRAKSEEKVGLLRGALTPATAGDYTEGAIAAKKRLAEIEPVFKAKKDKWDRIQEQIARIQQASDDNEMQLGRIAVERLRRQGVLDLSGTPQAQPQAPQQPAAQPAQAPQAAPATKAKPAGMVEAGNVDLYAQPKVSNPQGGTSTVFSKSFNFDGKEYLLPSVTPDGRFLSSDKDVVDEFKRTGRHLGIFNSPDAANNYASQLHKDYEGGKYDKPQVSAVTEPKVTPMQLVQLHKQIRDASDVAAMETTSPKLRVALEQKRERLQEMFLKGMAALPSDGLRQRVIDITRDPTTGELVKNFMGRAAEGAGSGLVDMAEFVARNTAGRVMGPDSNAFMAELSQGMRDEAATWGLGGVPKEVAEKLAESFSGTLGQGLGSTASFLVPTTGALRLAQVMGASAKTMKALAVAIPGIAGGAQTGNSMRREAAVLFEQMVQAGEISPEEAQKGINQAELIGAFIIGPTESLSPAGRWAKRMAGIPAGQTLLKQMAQKMGDGGLKTTVQWLRGNGRRFIVDALSEGGEEAMQELTQSYLQNAAARGNFGNVAYDPNRDLGEGVAAGAGVGGIVGTLVSAMLGAFQGGNVQRQRAIAAAMKRGQQQAQQTPPAPGTQPPGATPGAPAPTAPQPPSPAGQTPQPAAPAPGAQQPQEGEDGKPVVKRWTFTGKDGQKLTVDATGTNDARKKFPQGFNPDFSVPPVIEDLPAPEAPAQDQAVPPAVEGEPIDKEWKAFAPESGTLGVPRSEMPQVKAEHRGALTQFLKGKGVASEEAEVLPGDLKPTQAEFSTAKVEKARKFEGGDRAILVSSDGYVVDGHHQWLAKLNDKPTEKMRVIRMDAPIKDLLATVKEFPSAKTSSGATPDATNGKEEVPTETPQGAVGGETPAPASPPAAGAGKPPAIARGQNNAATFHKTVSQASKTTGRASKFIADFSGRMAKMNPGAFRDMEVNILTDDEWRSNERTGKKTPDSAGAYDPETNTLYINSDKNQGEAIVNTIVHEAGHFAEKFALGEAFTQREWEKLKPDQRVAAYQQYTQNALVSGGSGDLTNNKRARAEWVAMQFTRVVRGETEGMSLGMKARLEAWLKEVRELVNKWIGNGKLTTKELDAKIIEILGYSQAEPNKPKPISKKSKPAEESQPQKPEKVIGKNPAGQTIIEDENGVRSVKNGGFILTEPVEIIPTRQGIKSSVNPETREEAYMTPEEIAARKQKQQAATPPPVPPAPAPKPAASKADELADKLFDGLLGTPTDIKQEGFPRDRRQLASQLAETLIDDKVSTPEALAAWLDNKFQKKARKFSQALWSQLVSLDPALPAAPDWNAVYGTIDNPTAKEQGAENEQLVQNAANLDEGQPAGSSTPTGGNAVEPTEQSQRPGSSGREGNGENAPQGDGQTGSRGSGVVGDSSPGEPDRTGSDGADDGSGVRGDREEGGQPRGRDSESSHDLRIQPDDTIVPSGRKARAQANFRAIKLLRKLEKAGRNATPEEKRILTQFSGWGDLFQIFGNVPVNSYGLMAGETYESQKERNYVSIYGDALEKYNRWKKDYGDLYDQARELLNGEEWESAKGSTLNAHYTSREVIESMWGIARHLGFKQGKAVEPSAGIGLIVGLQPDEIAQKTKWVAVELDNITGSILKMLYPNQDVQVTGFEKSLRTEDNTADLVITNFPFGNYPVADIKHPDYDGESIHNYFLGRSVAMTKPGGIVLAVTSRYTLDGVEAGDLRRKVGNNAELIGAIRLPNTAFKGNAGTEVVTDILILRKKTGLSTISNEGWGRSSQTEIDGATVNINEYFVNHPEMVLGKPSMKGSMYGGKDKDGKPTKEYTVEPIDGKTISEAISEAVARLPANVFESDTETAPQAEEKIISGKKEDSYSVDGGKVYQVDSQGRATQVFADSKAQQAKAKKLIEMRDALVRQIEIESSESIADSEVEENRAKLNKLYDAFVKTYGPINSRGNDLIDDDPEWPLLASLEEENQVRVSENGRERFKTTYTKGAPLLRRFNFPVSEPDKADNIDDALSISLNFRGGIYPEFIAKLTDSTAEEATAKLLADGKVFKNPETGLLEMPDQYLSGFVREKLAAAKLAAETDQAYTRNVEELEKVQPKIIPASQLSFRLGSSWIPKTAIENFFRQVLGIGSTVTMVRTPDTVSWSIEVHSGKQSAENTQTWSGGGTTADELILSSLNLKLHEVSYTVEDEHGNKTRVVDMEKTAAARDMQERIQGEFRRWALNDAEQATTLEKAYHEAHGGVVVRKIEVPNIAHFPGASPLVDLRPWQKRGAVRASREGTILAHSVGTGKTYTIITAAMEMRRLKIARKPMVVVQNSTLGQFARSFRTLYPSANILVANEKNTKGDQRARFIAKAATREWDAIIIPQSFFERIPNDSAREKDYVNEQLAILESAIREAEGQGYNPGGRLKTTLGKQLERSKKRYQARLDRIQQRIAEKQDDMISFEKMGVDALVIDEAHAFKRGDFFTKMERIKGLDTNGSGRALDFLMKTSFIHERTPDRNVILATGTPISNTLAEMWTMARYVKPNLLKKFGVETFDDFVGTFARAEATIEETPTGDFKQVLRLSRYTNGPELTAMWRSVADIYAMNRADLPGVPKIRGGGPKEIVVKRPQQLGRFIDFLWDWRAWYEELDGQGKRAWNYVPILHYTLARKATPDMRLIDPTFPDDPNSKLNTAVAEIFKRWQDTRDISGTQLLFCNLYQSHDPRKPWINEELQLPNPHYGRPAFNVFKEIKRKLVALGIPDQQIADVTEMSKAQLDAAAEKIKTGEISVALGTTETLGTGLNVQDHITDIHHIDPLFVPKDFTQRNGRGERQGNQNAELGINVFGVERSLDSALYGLMLKKAGFIAQSQTEELGRDFEDPSDGSTMTFQQMAAAFSGNPLQAKKFSLENEIRQLEILETDHANKRRFARDMIEELERAKDRYVTLKEKTASGRDRMTKAFPDGKVTRIEWLRTKEVWEGDTLAAGMKKTTEDLVQGMISGLEEEFNAKTLLTNIKGTNKLMPSYGSRSVSENVLLNGVRATVKHTVTVWTNDLSQGKFEPSVDSSFTIESEEAELTIIPDERPWNAYLTKIQGTARTGAGIQSGIRTALSSYEKIDDQFAKGDAEISRQLSTRSEEAAKPFAGSERLTQQKAVLDEVNTQLQASGGRSGNEKALSSEELLEKYPEFAYMTRLKAADNSAEVLEKITADEREKDKKRYYVWSGDAYLLAKQAAKASVKGASGLDLFVMKEKGTGSVWRVIEASTGTGIARGDTKDAALKKAEQIIAHHGVDTVKAKIFFPTLIERGVSPRSAAQDYPLLRKFSVGKRVKWETGPGTSEVGNVSGIDGKRSSLTVTRDDQTKVFVPVRLVKMDAEKVEPKSEQPAPSETPAPNEEATGEPMPEVQGQRALPMPVDRVRVPRRSRLRTLLERMDAQLERLQQLEDESVTGSEEMAAYQQRIAALDDRRKAVIAQLRNEEAAGLRNAKENNDLLGTPAQVETPEFKTWFAGSAVRDENGNPQVVYHGTPTWENTTRGTSLGNFTVFDPQQVRKAFNREPGMDQVGSWFSSKPGNDGAGKYAPKNPEHGSGGAIYPVYLSIKRPFMMSFPEFLELGQKVGGWKKGDPAGRFDGTKVRKYLQERGWDGILFEETNIDGGDHWVWVAFEPTQIKSAIGNRGAFNPSEPSILGTPAVKASPTQEATIKKVNGTLEDKRTFYEKVRDYLADLGDWVHRKAQQEIFDRFFAIKRLERETLGTDKSDASISAYKWSRLTGNLAGVMGYLMEHGQLAYRNGSMEMVKGTKGLVQILKPIVDSGKLHLWEGYVTAYRADRLLAEGKEKNFGKYQDPQTGEWKWDANLARQEIDDLLALAKTHPELETVRQEYVAFQKSVLDVAQAAGLLDPAKRAMWERSDYVPFYRIVETLDGKETKGPNRRRGFSGQNAGIRKLKGGPQQVAILENIFRNIEQMVDASFKNIAMQRITDLADQNRDLMVPIPYKAIPFKTTVEETIERLEAAGVDTTALTPADLREIVTFWRMRAPEGKDVVSVMHNGKPAYYRVKDKLLLNSILALGPEQHSWWMKALMQPKAALTNLVTLDPAFMAANTIRDSFSAWVIADSPIKPGFDTARGFVKSLNNDPVKLGIMAAGGGSGHYNNLRESEVRKAFLRMTRDERGAFLSSIIDSPAKVWKLYKEIGRATENANRIAIAESALKNGASPAEAAFQALDIMDFGLRGDSKALAFFLNTVPFMNARIQGLYRLGRGLTGNPKRVATHGAYILGGTLALLAYNWDDERYWDLPEWDRDLYYHLWLGDRHIRIPKPFEVGQIFSTLPERFMQVMSKDGDKRIFARRVLSMIGDTFAMNPTPQAMKPLLERATNTNFLTLGRIISRGDEFKAPEQQYGASTSLTARKLAEAMPNLSQAEWLRSPKTVEHLIRGYFGTIGMYAIDAADALIRANGNYPTEPETKLGDYWLMRRFAPESDLRENKYVAEFYELHGDIQRLATRIRVLRESGDFTQANEVAIENRDLLAYNPSTTAAYNTMNVLRRREVSLRDNPGSLTPEQLRDELARLKAQRNRLAKQTMSRAPRRPEPIYNPFR